MKRIRSLYTKLQIALIASILATALLYTVVSINILRPRQEKELIAQAQTASDTISSGIDVRLQEMVMYASVIQNSEDLSSSLEDYYRSPAGSNSSVQVDMVLSALISRYPIQLKSVLLVDENGNRFSSFSFTDDDMSYLQDEWYNRVLNANSLSVFSDIYPVEQFRSSYCLVYAQKASYSGRSFSVFTIAYADTLLQEANQQAQTVLDNYKLLNNSMDSFYILNEDIPFDTGNFNFNPLQDTHIYSTAEGTFLVNKIYNGPWYLVSFLSEETLHQSFLQSYSSVILMFLSFCVLSVGIISILTYRFLKPLRKLTDTMTAVSAGNYDLRAEITASDEIGNLAIVFNHMLDSLQTQFSQLLQKERQEEKLKYTVLAGQIDPHFICNTISKVNSLTRQKRYDDVLSVNTSLIAILRDRLKMDGLHVFVTLKQEIESLKQYIRIITLNDDTDVSVNWELEDQVLDLPVPQNILQPLVENALLHGLTDEQTGNISGTLIITAKLLDGKLFLSIYNSGNIIEKNLLRKLNAGISISDRGRSHIGLTNIQSRLFGLYQDHAHFEINSDEGVGTEVVITIDPTPPNLSWLHDDTELG